MLGNIKNWLIKKFQTNFFGIRKEWLIFSLYQFLIIKWKNFVIILDEWYQKFVLIEFQDNKIINK